MQKTKRNVTVLFIIPKSDNNNNNNITNLHIAPKFAGNLQLIGAPSGDSVH